MKIYKVGSEYFTDPEIADDYRRRLSRKPRKLKIIETVEERLPTNIAFRVYGIYDRDSGIVTYSDAVINDVDQSVEHINTVEIYCMTTASIWFFLILKSRSCKELDQAINDQGFRGHLGKTLCELSKKSQINIDGKIIEKI